MSGPPQIAGYDLISCLDVGGMGEVWRAVHRKLGRPAAIKLIRKRGDTDKRSQRFEREARATALLRSPHTIELYDYGIADDGSFYYAMELLEGWNLQSLVGEHGPLPPGRVVSILRQVCESLAEAHQRGLVHRDIKPGNIFLCNLGLKYDFVKVLDFGLVKVDADSADAQLTDDNLAEGTPAYMPPEVVNGVSRFDARSDLYSLGCVAYWLLTGQLLFSGASSMEVVIEHVRRAPQPPSARIERPIPGDLEDLVMACLEKDPERRPRSAHALYRMLSSASMPGWSNDRAELWWRTHRPSD